MLFTKELKNIGINVILIEIISFLLNLFFFHSSTSAYFEIILTLIASVYCSFLIYNTGDIDILLTCGKPIEQIIFIKYIALTGSLLILGFAQAVFLSLLKNDGTELVKYASSIPTCLFMSSFSILATALSKNTAIGILFTLLAFPVQLFLGYNLSLYKLPPWYEYFSFFDTTFLYNSPNLPANRIIILSAAFVLWVVIYLLLHGGRWSLSRLS